MFRLPLSAALIAVLVSGCTTLRETSPTQTAREQLLLSKAADQASAEIQPNLPLGTKIYIDTSDFGVDNGAEYQKEYAVGAIEAALLKDGYPIVPKPDDADTIASIRSGALSINKKKYLIGIPSAGVPIPFTGTLHTPTIAFYSNKKRTGVAKFGVAFYDAKTGAPENVMDPIYGFSHFNQYSVLFFGWTHSNLLPPAVKKKEK
jgi:hypothetical protein